LTIGNLNALGAEGWRLVLETGPGRYVFMRRKDAGGD
jgi:hypothetical protein